MITIGSLTSGQLKDLMLSHNFKGFRSKQIFEYIHKHHEMDLEKWRLLPKNLRSWLKDNVALPDMEIEATFSSEQDDTKKFLFKLQDHHLIEGVLMHYQYGYTLCVSSQVGCAMGCQFCASTQEGKVRDLTTAEMLWQVYLVENQENVEIKRIVLMGSGEPLDNLSEVLPFLELLHDEKGKNMSYRNMTLSTCGVVPGIYQLAEWNEPINLAISLHYVQDEVRNEIMPINKAYPIEELIVACRHYFEVTGRRITFEYVLIENLNDGEEDIKKLAELAHEVQAHVNLIPLNPIEEFKQSSPKFKKIENIKQQLEKLRVPVSIRRELGQDISASCGQLRRSYKGERNGN